VRVRREALRGTVSELEAAIRSATASATHAFRTDIGTDPKKLCCARCAGLSSSASELVIDKDGARAFARPLAPRGRWYRRPQPASTVGALVAPCRIWSGAHLGTCASLATVRVR
jgi:hypothetical protein